MNSTIDEILNIMDELLDKAPVVPLSVKKVMIDRERMHECIDDLRMNLPTEFKQARHIAHDRNDILRTANNDAENIIKRAEERARVLVSNDEIVKTARKEADEILRTAQDRAKQVKGVVDSYIDRVMSRSEEAVRASLEEIRKTKSELKGLPLVQKNDKA
jgi:vacuolar-type H+-ATPase subunit H